MNCINSLITGLIDQKYHKFIVYAGQRPYTPGEQVIVRFPNGYGASIIKGLGTYGLELAVLKFTGSNPYDFDLIPYVPVTEDVLGYLDSRTLNRALKKIKKIDKYRRLIKWLIGKR